MIHSPLGIQPFGGVLQHVVELLRPIGEFGLRVFPVILKPVDYNDIKNVFLEFLIVSSGTKLKNFTSKLAFVQYSTLGAKIAFFTFVFSQTGNY